MLVSEIKGDWRVRVAVQKFLQVIGDKEISDITDQDAITFVKMAGILPNSAIRYLVTIKSFGASFKLPKHKNHRLKRKYIIASQISLLLKQVRSQKLKDMILLAIKTGLRRGEMFELRYNEIDWERKLIVKDHNTTKTGNTRVIPFESDVEAILKKYMLFNTSGKLEDVTMKRESFSIGVMRAAKRAGLNVSAHGLRHSFATILKDQGISPYTLSALMGHSSIKTTELYWHYTQSDEDIARAMLKKF